MSNEIFNIIISIKVHECWILYQNYQKPVNNYIMSYTCYLYIIVVGMVETTGTGYRIDG